MNALGADTEYWTQASNIVLRAKDEALSATRVRPQEPEEEPEAVQTEVPEPRIAEDRRARLAAERADPTLRMRRKAIEGPMAIGLTEQQAEDSVQRATLQKKKTLQKG